MHYTMLAEELEAIGHKLYPTALRRIEINERRVDVDDIVALSKVLGFSVEDLLYKDLEIR